MLKDYIEHPDLSHYVRHGYPPGVDNSMVNEIEVEVQGQIYDGYNGDKYLWCMCGDFNYIGVNKVWKIDNEFFCKRCIDEYVNEHLSQYVVK
jgi:hypothetical protein